MTMEGVKPDEEVIIRRAAKELCNGMLVNLGIGMPTLIPRVIPQGTEIVLHSENGFVGMGPPDPHGTRDSDVIDAGGRAVTLVKGAATFDSAMSFALVRGGNLDVAVLGAFEVSIAGDLANWMIPGKLTPGMGGGMELAQKARHLIVISRHTDKKGRPKLLPECQLPLTARECVDTLITEKAVFRRRNGRMTLVSVHSESSVEDALAGMQMDVPVAEKLEPWD